LAHLGKRRTVPRYQRPDVPRFPEALREKPRPEGRGHDPLTTAWCRAHPATTKETTYVSTKQTKFPSQIDLSPDGDYRIRRPGPLGQDPSAAAHADDAFDDARICIETCDLILSAIFEHQRNAKFVKTMLAEAFRATRAAEHNLEAAREAVHQAEAKAAKQLALASATVQERDATIKQLRAELAAAKRGTRITRRAA
jgi:hypothetical protein